MFLGFAFFLCVTSTVHAVSVRIIEGIDKKSDKDDTKLDYVEPDRISGPPSLYFMKGSCFTGSFDRYEYSVCPFHNITQRRTTALKPQLIGLWGDWKTSPTPLHTQKVVNSETKSVSSGESNRGFASIASTTLSTESTQAGGAITDYMYFNTMVYPKGKNCGVEGESIAYVYLQCEHTDFEIISVDSESSCKYSLTLGLPISCSLLRG